MKSLHSPTENLQILSVSDAKYYFEEVASIISDEPNYPEFMRRLRIIMEDMYSELCINEQRNLDTLAKCMSFIAKKYILPVHLNKEFYALKNCTNTYHHTNKTNGIEQREAAIRAVCMAISYFSNLPVPDEIERLYRDIDSLTLIRENKKAWEKIAFDRVVVTKIEEKYEGELFVVDCESELGHGTYQLNLKNHEHQGYTPYGQEFTEVGKLLWEYATLHVFNISKDNNRDHVYYTYFQSLIVVEPDYLIDATFLASCFYEDKYAKKIIIDPRLSLLEKLSGTKPNRWLLQGALANDCLDQLLRFPDAPFLKVFQQAMGSQVWNVVNGGKRAILELKENLEKKHFPNIKRFASEMQNRDLTIEPTFYSAHYGLQGRLDLLSHDPERNKGWDIYELKSGNPPEDSSQVSINHEMQVIAYNLLLKSTFGKSHVGRSLILYSQASQTALREIEAFFQSEQKAIRARNELISYLFAISRREFGFYDFIQTEYFQPLPPYPSQKSLIGNFCEDYQNATQVERAYFNEFSAFVLRELQTGKVGDINPREGKNSGFAGLWHKDLQDKKEAFAVLYDLEYIDETEKEGIQVDTESQVVTLRRSSQGFSNFRKNDIAIVYPQDEGELRPLSYQIHKCTILSLGKDQIQLKLRNSQADLSYFKKYSRWVLEHDFLERGYFSMLESLRLFLGTQSKKKRVFLGLEPPRFKQEPADKLQFDIMGFTLKPTQAEALNRALSAEDYMLIQGPPGTGKTSRVLLSLLLHLHRYTSESIVVLAFTNKAVNKIIEHIDSYNQKNKGHEKVEYLHLAGAHRNSPNSLTNIAKGKKFNEVQSILDQRKLFIGTIASFQSHQHLLPTHLELDTLIIDEASQLIEPQVAGIIPRFRRFILIGDHNQLPAVTVQREKLCRIDNPELSAIGISDLRTSVFERLWKQAINGGKLSNLEAESWNRSIYTLSEHFRMHSKIAELVNPNYGGKLKLGIPKEQLISLPFLDLKDELESLLANSRLLFIESPNGRGKSHPKEAIRVVRILKILDSIYGKNFNPDTSVGVITPWRAQINMILGHSFRKKKLNMVSVDTVERFQGSERDTIILSTATSEPIYIQSMQSLNQNEFDDEVDRKLNVAISRAENRLIILGQSWILSKSKHYGRLIKKIKQSGGYVGLDRSIRLFGETTHETESNLSF